MKHPLSQSIQIPEDITCKFQNNLLSCKKNSLELSRKINSQNITLSIKDKLITLNCQKGNKKDYKTIKSLLAHIENIFRGLSEDFVYKLEIANIHFPMTAKVEQDRVSISNFLGEKVPRYAKILPNVKIEIKSPRITVSSHNKESAGQTAANLEKATIVKNRDRRIYQDGIFIIEKPRREK